MSRNTLIAVALSTVALGALPLAHANAQSGPSNAERTCALYGVTPSTPAFNVCIDRAASALNRGDPVRAEQQAALIRDANDLCSSYGIAPATLGYRECVNGEVQRRTVLEPANYTPSTYGTPTFVDSFGFRHDTQGNLFDPDGRPIRPVP